MLRVRLSLISVLGKRYNVRKTYRIIRWRVIAVRGRVHIINLILKSSIVIHLITSHWRCNFVSSLRPLDALLEPRDKEMSLLVGISQLTYAFWVQVNETKVGCITNVTFKMDRSLLHGYSFSLYKRIILADSRVLD